MDNSIYADVASAFVPLHSDDAACIYAEMNSNAELAGKIRAWMLDVLKAKGWTPTEWAREAGVSGTTAQRAVKEDYEFVTSSKTLAKLARAANVSPPGFAAVESGPGSAKMIPVVGSVQAGIWIEVHQVEEPEDYIPFYDPQYARARVFAMKVKGPSANKVYPEDTTIIVVPTAEAGVRDGDFVVVKRFDITGKAEYTLKQAVNNGGTIEFWPRSTDPRYQKPIIVPKRSEQADEGLEVWGVVIGSYQKAGPRTGDPLPF